MAWRRRKPGASKEEVQPQAPPVAQGPPLPEMLPVLDDVGTTTDREATKRLKTAEADLKRLKKKEQKALKTEMRRQRAIEKRLARIEISRERRPYTLISFLITTTGIAAAFAVILLLFPEWRLYDPIFYQDSAHWEVIAISFIAGGVGSVLLLAGNPSSEYQDSARMSFFVYFGVGLCIMFSGALVALVLEPLQDWEMDWELLITVLALVAAGSGLTLLVVHYASRSGGSRWFLSGRYHGVMGTMTAVFVVSLILLGLFYLASEELMLDVGLAMMIVGGLVMLFPLPGLVAVFAIERYEDMGVIIAFVILMAIVLILFILSGWIVD
ncbi:MAG: hypothetical protein KAS77_11985, partial [Thermoplasmata archaeon]|nr:hypothetical protein [Thermoplasmata archaeon]